jgi:hypothetical protein
MYDLLLRDPQHTCVKCMIYMYVSLKNFQHTCVKCMTNLWEIPNKLLSNVCLSVKYIPHYCIKGMIYVSLTGPQHLCQMIYLWEIPQYNCVKYVIYPQKISKIIVSIEWSMHLWKIPNILMSSVLFISERSPTYLCQVYYLSLRDPQHTCARCIIYLWEIPNILVPGVLFIS